MGINICALPCADARNIALSCVKNISGSDNDQRIPRKPSGEIFEDNL